MGALAMQPAAAPPPDDDMIELPDLPSADPTAPRALAMLNERKAALDALEEEAARLSLDGKTEALRAQLPKIATAKSEVDLAERAHASAVIQDRGAAKRRIEAIRALPPEQAVIGITKHDCCELCRPGECVLAGGINLCLHPMKAGYPAHLHNDRVVQAFRKAACEEIHAAEDDDDE